MLRRPSGSPLEYESAEIRPAIAAIHERLNARPAVQATLKAEGLA